MVKKEDMVVVPAQKQRVVGDGRQLEHFLKENVILPGGECGSGCFGKGAILIARDCLTIEKL
jgi:hypothetical protein